MRLFNAYHSLDPSLAGMDKLIEKWVFRQAPPRHANRLVHEGGIKLLPHPDVGGPAIQFGKSLAKLIVHQ